MILIEFYKGQGLGNQMWCYSACRSIAEHLNMPYMILGRENFKGNDFLEIESHSKSIPDDFSLNNQNVTVYFEKHFLDKELDYISSGYDSTVERLSSFTKIEGLFQSEKYFFDNPQRIISYFKIKDKALTSVSIDEDLCILNIRGGEYKKHSKFILPKSYWLRAIENMKMNYGIVKFLIVTDDPKYAKILLPGIPILKGGIAECYIALHKANFLIVSNSTFSYFPIKTKSTRPIVIAPKHWARFGNSYSRWASPANIYEKWLWQDFDGNLKSYENCIEEARENEETYWNQYNVMILPKSLDSKKLKDYIPVRLKNIMKRILSHLFPSKF
jgi:hypothetical protein